MTLLITGGTGFVLSNLARHWLETNPAANVIVLDSAPWDAPLEQFFAGVRDRLTFLRADVLDPAAWTAQIDPDEVTAIVHGAAICRLRELEAVQPQLLIEVNVTGTLNLLEWARQCKSLRRFIYTSSGSVYGEPEPGTTPDPYPEDGNVDPVELYGITKLAGEHITRRYGELFGLPVASVRFSSVYGPMDRETPSRAVQTIPYQLTHLALAQGHLTVSDLAGGGDWIHVGDVARALTALLQASRLQHPVYNVSYGEFVTLDTLLQIIQAALPALTFAVVPAASATVVHDSRRRLAQWGAYDNSRLRAEFGWSPRPIALALADYVHWLQTESPLAADRPSALAARRKP